MPKTLAFDVYGTLIDTAGVVRELTGMMGDLAPAFSQRWRDKQLEYSFRRGLMGEYRDFSVCTRDALEYVSAELSAPLTEEQVSHLMASYRRLPAFGDALGALPRLGSLGHKIYAFSNGLAQDVDALLRYAGIDHFFLDIVSADEIRTFKPDPAIYRHFSRRSDTPVEHCWLISSNPFDVLGASAVGFNTAWVRRNPSVPFDPWGVEPDQISASLTELEHAAGLHQL